MATHSDFSDTSDDALAVQLECLRQMTPNERLRRACAWSGQVRRMAFDAIRRRHPEYSEDDVRLKFIELTYGKALADGIREQQSEQRRATTTILSRHSRPFRRHSTKWAFATTSAAAALPVF